MAAPEELVRVVAQPGVGLRVGRSLPGRGAWFCAGSPSCVVAAARRNALAKALRTSVAPAEFAILRDELAERGKMEAPAN